MKKWIIMWDAGFGKEYDEIEAETEEIASDMAYQQWRDDAESNASYGVIGESTDELREDYID